MINYRAVKKTEEEDGRDDEGREREREEQQDKIDNGMYPAYLRLRQVEDNVDDFSLPQLKT